MGKQTTFTFQADDETEIFVRKWTEHSLKKPDAIIQIAHGMAEHSARYDFFARRLLEDNIYVYGNDHRGHGMTANRNNSSGYFADEDGFEKVVQDMSRLTDIIVKEFPDTPIFLFGHSMGSFLSRRYIQLFGARLSGVILCGTGGDPGLMGKMGRFIAAWEIKRKGRKTPSPLLNKLIFGNYNKAFRPNRTDFDWLSRDEFEVDKYIKDPSCGGIFTAGFFHDLLIGLETINDAQNINCIPADLPIFFVSGSKDPVGANTKGVLSSFQALKQEGIQDVTYRFYENARHELLNERNKEEVIDDSIQWIRNRLN